MSDVYWTLHKLKKVGIVNFLRKPQFFFWFACIFEGEKRMDEKYGLHADFSQKIEWNERTNGWTHFVLQVFSKYTLTIPFEWDGISLWNRPKTTICVENNLCFSQVLCFVFVCKFSQCQSIFSPCQTIVIDNNWIFS